MKGLLLSLFQTVLDLSIVGTYVILFVLVARLLLRKAPKWCSYVLWGVVFLRLVCPIFPEGQFSLIPERISTTSERFWEERNLQAEVNEVQSEDWLSAQNSMVGESTIVEGMQAPVVENGEVQNNQSNQQANSVAEDMPTLLNEAMGELDARNNMQTLSGENATLVEVGGLNESTQQPRSAFTYEVWIAIAMVWLLGACALLTYHAFSYWHLKVRVRDAKEVETGVCEIQGDHLSFVLGILRPTIYLSEGLDAESRRVILCHERVHIKRKDYITKPLTLGICCVHWFNPFAWLAFYLMNKDCEMSCDEMVVSTLGEESKKVYSYTLLDEATKGKYKKDRGVISCAALSFGEENVKNRIQHVLNYRKASFWVIAVVVVLLLVVTVGLCCNPKENDSNAIAGEQMQENSEAGENPENMESGESPENIEGAEQKDGNWTQDGLNLTSHQEDAYDAVYRYAQAFADRDGGVLYALASDKENFENWDMVYAHGGGKYSFGFSSPWTSEGCFTVEYKEGASEAQIRFLMFTFVPEISVAIETVSIEQVDGLYYVNHKEYQEYSKINTAEELKKVYQVGEDNLFKIANTGYSTGFFWTICHHLQKGTNPEYYSAYQDPVTAARLLLYLGDGDAMVHYNNGWINYPGQSLPEDEYRSLYEDIKEGDMVTVRYTFAEDGSTIDIPMVFAEKSTGMWAIGCELSSENKEVEWTEGNYFARKVYKSLEADGGVVYELSNYGVYMLRDEEITCVYPYAVPSDVPADTNGEKLYFMTDSQTYGEALDWMYDSMCVIGPDMGGYELIPLDEETQKLFPLSWMTVDEGFIFLYSENSSSTHTLILENKESVWNYKIPADLTEKEENEWGVSNREYILENKHKFVEVGYRTAEETFAVIDLDGDGDSERISITANEQGWDWPMDNFTLRAGEGMEEISGCCVSNSIWAFSPDGERIFIALYQDGPSGDPLTSIYKYENDRLRDAGSIANDVRYTNIVDGRITTAVRNDAVQTSAIRVQYFMNRDGDVELVQEEMYEFVNWSEQEIYLQQELEVLGDLHKPSTAYTLEPQQVWFSHLDNTMDSTGNWVLLESASGKSGWFYVENGYQVGEEKIPSQEIFAGLSFAG